MPASASLGHCAPWRWGRLSWGGAVGTTGDTGRGPLRGHCRLCDVWFELLQGDEGASSSPLTDVSAWAEGLAGWG